MEPNKVKRFANREPKKLDENNDLIQVQETQTVPIHELKNEMYIGSVMCWGTTQINFQTEGEEELFYNSNGGSQFLILRNKKEQLVTINILFQPLFTKLIKNSFGLGTVKFWSRVRKNQFNASEERKKSKSKSRSVSPTRPKKKREKNFSFMAPKLEKWITIPIRIDIFFGKQIFSEYSREYVQKINELQNFKAAHRGVKFSSSTERYEYRQELEGRQKAITHEKVIRAFLFYFIEKTNTNVLNRSFIKPSVKMNSFIRQFRSLTIGFKKKDTRFKANLKITNRINSWKKKFKTMGLFYPCAATKNHLKKYYEKEDSEMMLWRNFKGETFEQIAQLQNKKFKERKILYLNEQTHENIMLSQNLIRILEQIGAQNFEKQEEDKPEESDEEDRAREGDEKFQKQNQQLMKRFQEENKHFREHPSPEGMLSKLKPYQQQALQWMKYREGKIPVEELFRKEYLSQIEDFQYERKLSPFWQQVILPGGNHFYLNYLTGQVSNRFHEWKSIKGGILADQMGLGKTVMTLSLIADEKYEGLNLIIVPVTVLRQWQDEIIKHCGKKIKVFEYHSDSKKRKTTDLNKYDIVITTYQTFGTEYRNYESKKEKGEMWLFDYQFRRVILDEAHNIKTPETYCSQGVLLLKSQYSWCLTGTLIQNSEQDLFSIFRFLRVEVFSESYWWNLYIKNCGSFYSKINILQTVLRPIVLRRTKQSTYNEGKNILDLTKKQIILVKPRFSKLQSEIYEKLQKGMKIYFDESKSTLPYTHIFQIIGKLRLFCCHPSFIFGQALEDVSKMRIDEYLSKFLGKSSDVYKEKVIQEIQEENQVCGVCLQEINDKNLALTNCGHVFCESCIKTLIQRNKSCAICRKPLNSDSYRTKEQIEGKVQQKARQELKSIKLSTKQEALMKIIDEIRERNEKAVIFSQWMKMLDLIHDRLLEKGIEFAVIKGENNVNQRQKAIKRFKQKESCEFLVVSIRAGSTGLNLTNANNVIICDPWWNPAQEEQAIGRVHRIGQEKDVRVYKLLMKDSIEEKIERMHKQKMQLADQVMMQRKNKIKTETSSQALIRMLYDY